jgi:cytoskeleton protein RodZ
VGLALLLVLGAGLIVINLTVKRTGGTSVAAPKMDLPAQPGSAPVAVPAVEAPRPPAPPPPASPAVEAPAPPASAPGAGQAPPLAGDLARTGVGPQRLVMKAVEPTWIRVQPDEGRATEELLPAGASREWAAERRFLVTVGNAGGVELILNGKALPPLGPKGAVIQRLELPQAPATGS